MLYDKIDQSVDFFYFILDMSLDEPKDRGLYYPTLQYIEPFASWLPKSSILSRYWATTKTMPMKQRNKHETAICSHCALCTDSSVEPDES